MLEAFGVDREVEVVYLALIDHPEAGVKEICQVVDLSEEQVRHALDQLAQLSLIRPMWQSTGTVSLISPDVALGYLVAREQAQLLQHQQQVERSRDAIAMLITKLSEEAERAPERSSVRLSQVFGLDAIRTKLAELAYGTTLQVLSLMPDGPQTSENLKASKPLDEMLLRRGVAILTIYLDSVANLPESRQYVQWLVEIGGVVRTTAVLPTRLLVFDRRIAVVPLNPVRSETGVAIIEGSGPVAAMGALFDQLWSTSTPFGQVRGTHPNASLTEQELAVVRLLAEGHTDAAISRKLGVSERTAGRLASEIMTMLGAKSRFQAGLRIGELGWHLLPPGTGSTPDIPQPQPLLRFRPGYRGADHRRHRDCLAVITRSQRCVPPRA
jgi:DNA-binding CsgD family transcriptional regulator/sugar-specific transcriptional regulator TrmB